MRTIITPVALAFLAACTGSGSRLAPPGTGIEYTTVARDAGRYAGTVFVSDLDSGAVWICPANGNDIRKGYLPAAGQLQGVSDPVQLAVDAQARSTSRMPKRMPPGRAR